MEKHKKLENKEDFQRPSLPPYNIFSQCFRVIVCLKKCAWQIGNPEEEEKEKASEKIFEEIIVKKFPNMGKEIATKFQEAQRVSYRINPRKHIEIHINQTNKN